jgi:hypothetical protein
MRPPYCQLIRNSRGGTATQGVGEGAVEEDAGQLAAGDGRQEFLHEHARRRLPGGRAVERRALLAARDALDAEPARADERLDHRVVEAERVERLRDRGGLGDDVERARHGRAAPREFEHVRLLEIPADQRRARRARTVRSTVRPQRRSRARGAPPRDRRRSRSRSATPRTWRGRSSSSRAQRISGAVDGPFF